ncbi:ankyrin repeat domain-containing protein [Microlunatus aurantiacus]|uniref:Ankyrin repeat domain-containing protein n=1 Tax=Microlunatus aurantiacus TaxID=446786 RepID=A0ABP7DH14_9ACTN
MPTASPPDPVPSGAVPRACWRLPDRPHLNHLRRQAKQLRRRALTADAEAVELVERYDAGGGPITLARAQRVLARAYGFAGWSKLREHLDVLEVWGRDMDATGPADGPVDAFLRVACLSYTEPSRAGEALALLRADATLSTATAATMAACGEAAALRTLLERHPAAVTTTSGPHAWPPLLYLCYARIGVGDPVATLRVLLEAGADPDAGFLWQRLSSAFTAVTGVLGGGERGEPAHPQAVELVTRLLDAGADPNDNQAFYNRQFRSDDSHLPPLLDHGAGRAHPSPWRRRLGSTYPSPEEMVGEHLRTAGAQGFTGRVELLLAHGVDPNTRGYHPVLGDQTAYELAIRNGHRDAAELLAAAGGRSDRLDGPDLLLSAVLAADGEGIARWRDHADTLRTRRPDALRLAGELHGAESIAGLLDLGYGVDVAGPDGRTALHEAALRGAAGLVEWLLDHGADPGVRDRDFAGTPADWAEHSGHHALAERLRTARTT